ncbi:hypothetical protein KA977_02335 [Candidatus Dependentiae bacterium]|nr:hypothetical protein [Candidatus Dependentiae bacterium]
MHGKILNFYESVVSCDSNNNICPRTEKNDSTPPRGFYSRGVPSKIDIMVIGKNPGHLLCDENGNEAQLYENHTPREKAEIIFYSNNNNININVEFNDPLSQKFHINLFRYLAYFLDITDKLKTYSDFKNSENRHQISENTLEKCLITNLVKCQTITEKEKLKAPTKQNCLNKFLCDEIRFWQPKVILCLGSETDPFIKNKIKKINDLEKYSNKFVQVRHPSYFYARNKEQQELCKIKSQITEILS